MLNFIRDANSLLVATLAFAWIFGAPLIRMHPPKAE
jgi:hypothetical protein